MKKTLRLTSIFFILLVIGIPFYISGALANSLEIIDIRASGLDNYRGYIRTEDQIRIQVALSDPDISASQVVLQMYDFGENMTFSSCMSRYTSAGRVAICEARYPPNESINFTFVPIAVGAEVYSKIEYDNETDSYFGGDKLGETGTYLRFDTRGPEITSFTVSPALASAESQVELEYSARDAGVGVASFEFYVEEETENGTTKSYSRTIDLERVLPTVRNSTKINVRDLTSSDGPVEISMIAYDGFGNPSRVSKASFTADLTPPEPDVGSLKIYDETNNLIEYVKDPFFGRVVFDVFNDGAVTANANFSLLHRTHRDLVPGSCSIADYELYRCVWENVRIEVNESKSVTIPIEVSDIAGNKVSVNPSYEFKYDNTSPVLKRITTDIGSLDGTYYAGVTTTFVAEFDEDGSGFFKNQDVRMSNIEPSEADNCTQNVCYWYNRTSDKDGNYSMRVSGADDMGNEIIAEPQNIIFDTTPPAFVNIEINPIAGIVPLVDSYIKTGDSMEIFINVSDKSPVRGIADLSSLVSWDRELLGDCEALENDIYSCTFLSNEIDTQGPTTRTLSFNFTDFAKNTFIFNYSLSILGLDNATEPNHWRHEIQCSPSVIDRQTTTLINHEVYCHVKLIPRSDSGARVLDSVFNFADCVGVNITQTNQSGNDTNVYTLDYLEDIDIMNDGPGSRDIYFKIILAKAEMKIDSLTYMCPYNIRSLASGKVGINYEQENITITHNFYNLPLGELEDSVKSKLRGVKNNFFVSAKFMGTLRTLLAFLEQLCNLFNGLISVVKIINDLVFLFGSQPWTTWAAQAPMTGTRALGSLQDGMGGVYRATCGWVTCDQTLWNIGIDDLNEKWSFFHFGTTVEGSETRQSIRPWSSPKDSMFLSIATGCIPGIIYNFDKMRQIQCTYGSCIIDSVEQNYPIKVCEDVKHYTTCKYWVGEAFYVVPFVNDIRNLMRDIVDMIKSPVGILFGVPAFLCGLQVLPQANFICTLSRITTNFGHIAGLAESLSRANAWKIQNDVCESFFDRLGDYDLD